MNYKDMQVKQFIEESSKGNIDIEDYHAKIFESIEKIQKKYNYFVTIPKRESLKQAKAMNKNKTKDKLAGLAVSSKDCLCTKGIETTAGSKILKGYIPPYDATVIKNIKDDNGIIIGKTVMDEFGFGTFCTNSAYGIPKNPIEIDRCCGGSSGGAGGLTTAINIPHIAIGESTGGSISCPAAYCGVVGLTPTYGLVSRYGHIDYANSLDKIGTLGKSVYDTALMLSTIAGPDPKEPTTINTKPTDYTKNIGQSIKGLKIGIPKEYFNGIDKDVEKVIRKAIDRFSELGAKSQEISLKTTEYVLPTYYVIATAEASTNLARYCGMRYGATEEIKGKFNGYFSTVRGKYFSDEAKRRILLGTYTRMAGYRDQYYLKAMKVRTMIINDFKKTFNTFDAIVAPTMPNIAPKFKDIDKLSPIETYAMDNLTVGPNLAGIPMISIPCGTVKGMPVGIHILADHLKEDKMLKVASALEKVLK
ncbi:MAG: Asp-tRNA(Asn)/Glu-tRNA(Gln) amidotransferase subunit GatA [DPANN group archaeon]|nr:Asp-tRNA(Asn)/Glu-tRNA(Gln) amidotransferase subunit GatA [DPANN group archaeon]